MFVYGVWNKGWNITITVGPYCGYPNPLNNTSNKKLLLQIDSSSQFLMGGSDLTLTLLNFSTVVYLRDNELGDEGSGGLPLGQE